MIEKFKGIYGKMNGREKALLYGALAAFVIMVTDLLVLNPILSHIKVLDAEIHAKSQAIQRDLRILSFKESILREYGRYEKYLDTGEKTQEEIIASLLKKLETVAAANNIKITNVMPGEIQDKPIYKIYKTTLDFEGSLKDTLSFMDILEASDNLFQIQQYTLTPKNKSGESLKVNMDVQRILITAEELGEFREDLEAMQAPPPPPMADMASLEDMPQAEMPEMEMKAPVPEPI